MLPVVTVKVLKGIEERKDRTEEGQKDSCLSERGKRNS